MKTKLEDKTKRKVQDALEAAKKRLMDVDAELFEANKALAAKLATIILKIESLQNDRRLS